MRSVAPVPPFPSVCHAAGAALSHPFFRPAGAADFSSRQIVRRSDAPETILYNGKITTLEGLGSSSRPHPLQAAFVEEQAAQCGYCMNGIIMTAKVLLDKNRHPSDAEIKQALNGNLCRCGSHLRVIKAVKRAAAERRA